MSSGIQLSPSGKSGPFKVSQTERTKSLTPFNCSWLGLFPVSGDGGTSKQPKVLAERTLKRPGDSPTLHQTLWPLGSAKLGMTSFRSKTLLHMALRRATLSSSFSSPGCIPEVCSTGEWDANSKNSGRANYTGCHSSPLKYLE